MPAHITTQKLRFCDTDRLGHVNNAVYAVMCEAGRADLLIACGLLHAEAPLVPVIVRLELDFLREMSWPGEVRIETEVLRIGNKSFHLRQHLRLEGELVGRAISVLALMEMATRRAVPLPPAWRAALAPYATEL
jgi:acyl-CoA thioester hydrolase